MKRVEAHPRWLGEQRRIIAEHRRFIVAMHEMDLWMSDAAEKLRDAIRASKPHPHARFAFENTLQPLLRLATEAELHGTLGRPLAGKKAQPTARDAEWRERYLTIEKGGVATIQLNAEGVLEDFDFWWWLMTSHGDLLVGVPRAKVDGRRLFAKTWDPFEDTVNVTRIVLRGRERATKGKLVYLNPFASDNKVGLGVMASAKDILKLHEDALAVAPFHANFLFGFGGLPRAVDNQGIAFTRISLEHADDGEAFLIGALKKGAKKPGDKKSCEEALDAAEIIAEAEGRGARGLGLGEEVVGEIAKWSKAHGPLALETITLARATVEKIAAAEPFDWKWVPKNSLGPWREALEDTRRRLAAAESARKARSKASNAKPLLIPADAAKRMVPGDPKSFRLYCVADDVETLFVLLARSGAHVYFANGRDLEQLKNAWEMRENLQARMKLTLIGVPETRFYLWWPDVGGEPTLIPHYWDKDEIDPDTGNERSVEQAWWGPGWGLARLMLRGETSATPTVVAISEIEYPTERDIRSPRFRLPGPWHDVDWKELRRRLTELRRLFAEVPGGSHARSAAKEPVLPEAARLTKAGIVLGDQYGLPRRTRPNRK